MKESDKRDYPELEGKEIVYITRCGSEDAIVVGCNYHIGITIVSRTNRDRYLNCCIGPMAPNRGGVYSRGQKDMDEWAQLFSVKIKQITEGIVYCPRMSPDNNVSAESCPFGQ